MIEILNRENQPKSINWDEPQALELLDDGTGYLVVLINGKHTETQFEGTVLIDLADYWQEYSFHKTWDKNKFRKLSKPLEIRIS